MWPKDIHCAFFGNVVRDKSVLLRLVVGKVSRTSSGKFLRVGSCYLESFGFLPLWSEGGSQFFDSK